MVKGWGLWEVPGSSPNVAKIYLSKEKKKKKTFFHFGESIYMLMHDGI